jgi:hypothetical protein
MQSTFPFKPRCIDEKDNEITLETIKGWDNDMPRKYFEIDTNHDHTSPGTAAEDKSLEEAFKYYGSRFNQIKFMLIDKTELDKIVKDGYTNERVCEVKGKNTMAEIKFEDYIKEVLEIDLGDIQDELKSCDTKERFYQYMRFFTVFDMGKQFPEEIPSASYIIDSASSVNKIENIPNVCVKIPIQIAEWHLPGTDDFEKNKNYSLFFLGDLQIADFYYSDLCLNKIVDNDTVIDGTWSLYSDAYKPLFKYSILALNIFWQNVISYVKIYIDLYSTNSTANDFKKALTALRHWVFTKVEVTNKDHVFKGRFFKEITNNENSVTQIPFWFLKHHDNVDALIEKEITDDITYHNKDYKFDAFQSNCARLINKIHPPQAAPRSSGSAGGIIDAILTDFKQQNYFIRMGQILKFTGDKSHQVSAELFRIVFEKRPEFKHMIGWVNSIDRPLILGNIMDNRPFIIPTTSAQLIRSLGLLTPKQNQRLMAFYTPKLKMTILEKMNQNMKDICLYLDLLKDLKDNEKEACLELLETEKDENIKDIIRIIYENIHYIILTYMSFFSYEVVHITFTPPAPAAPAAGAAAPAAGAAAPPAVAAAAVVAAAAPVAAATVVAAPALPGVGDYFIEDGRIHGAAIAYILYKQDLVFNFPTVPPTEPIIFGFDGGTIPPEKKSIGDVSFLDEPFKTHVEEFGNLDKAKFTDILDYYKLIKDNSGDIETSFMANLKLHRFMGGAEDNPIVMPTDMTDYKIDTYYNKYHCISLKRPSHELITICNLHKKHNILTNDIFEKEPTKEDMNTYFYNMFFYIIPNEKDPKLDKIAKLFEHMEAKEIETTKFRSYFTLLKEPGVLEFEKTKYMKPLFKITDSTNSIFTLKDVFKNKMENTVDGDIKDHGKNNSSSQDVTNMETVFERFTQYINDMIYLMETCKNFEKLKDETLKICNSDRCKLVVFLSLCFFKHSAKRRHLIDMYTILEAAAALVHIAAPALDDPFEVVGIFTDDYKNSFSFSGRAKRGGAGVGPSEEEKYAKIGGLYYINREQLRESYLELKDALKTFLSNYEELGVLGVLGVYTDIKID